MSTKLKYPVREFAQPNFRRGHIDALSGYRAEMSEGAEIHSRLQRRLQTELVGYSSEVVIATVWSVDEFEFHIGGRVDGVVTTENEILVEEIKTTNSYERLAQVIRDDHTHPYALQALTYALILAEQNPEKNILARLRIVSQLNGRELVVDLGCDLDAIKEWRDARCRFLIEERRSFIELIEKRRSISKQMIFPFKQTREPQQRLVEKVEAALADGKQFLTQAPTGLGKTAGVMFPTLRDALSRGKQLVYVTPKNSQHKLAEEVVQRLRQDQGLELRMETMTAKSKICMQAEPLCTPEHCNYARNFYDKCSTHNIVAKLHEEPVLNAAVFREYAERYEVCPFELSISTLNRVDVVIGDYNYVFSPHAALKTLMYDENEEPLDNHLVIDEVHNLPQRLSDYLSPQLDAKVFNELLERLTEIPEDQQASWKKLLRRCLKFIDDAAPQDTQNSRSDRCLVELDEERIADIETQINSFALNYFMQLEKPRENDPVSRLQRYWSGFSFAISSSAPEKRFISYRRDMPTPSLKISCADASHIGRLAMGGFKSVIGFSATVKPFDYYAKMCGFSDDNLDVAEFESPFPAENRKLMIIPQVSTRYSQRERNYARVADIINRVCERRVGNYFAFFPSYDFLRKTAPFIAPSGMRILQQEPYMSAVDAEAIVDNLREQSRRVLVLAVQGGIFAEGVDYPGDLLIGAFVIGPGLPGFDFERELLRKFYDETFGDGFAYAYLFPGMARVIQAAGRVIRTSEDRGVIILIDDRFLQPAYAELMPRDWTSQGTQRLVSTSIIRDIDQFWSIADDSDRY